MSYTSYEESTESGTPIELYEFTQGVQRWSYTNCANTVLYNALNFIPSSIKRDNVKQTTDTFKDSMKVVFPRGDVFAAQFLGFAPEAVTTVTIYRGHYGDPDKQFIVYWKGRIVGAKTSGNQVEVQCESIFTSIKRPGLRARYEYGCRRTLYMRGCNVDKEAFKYRGNVTAITGGLNVDVYGASNKPDGYYTGGMIIDANGVPRFIINHVGNVVTLTRPLHELSVGDTVALYPGCDHLKETCKNKFNNLDNFGGFPWIPSKNPYGGSSVA